MNRRGVHVHKNQDWQLGCSFISLARARAGPAGARESRTYPTAVDYVSPSAHRPLLMHLYRARALVHRRWEFALPLAPSCAGASGRDKGSGEVTAKAETSGELGG